MALPCSRPTPFPPKAISSISRSTTRIESPRERCTLPRKGTFNGGFQVFKLDRFDQMFGKTRLQTSFNIAIVAKAADGDSRDFGDRAQLHHEIHAASVWQSNIADEQIKLIAHCRFHGRADVVGSRHEMPPADKQFLQSSACVLVIVNEQNFQTLLRSFTGCFAMHGDYFSRRKRWHRKDERRAAIAPTTLRSEGAAVRLRERF